jgi:hypothetical protein
MGIIRLLQVICHGSLLYASNTMHIRKKKRKKEEGRIFVEVDLIVVTLFDKFVVPLLL